MSANLDDVIRLLADVAGQSGWRRCNVAISREDLGNAEGLAARLQQDPPVSGWVVAQSGHHLILGGVLPDGRWLEGEWLAQSGASYQLRDVPGGWVLARVREGEGEAVLVIERRHLADRGAPGDMLWNVYHQTDGLQCVPVAAAFRGFANRTEA